MNRKMSLGAFVHETGQHAAAWRRRDRAARWRPGEGWMRGPAASMPVRKSSMGGMIPSTSGMAAGSPTRRPVGREGCTPPP